MLTGVQKGPSKLGNRGPSPAIPSPALEWLWQHLQDVPHPHVLDCGPVKPATVNVLLQRGAKLYVADLVSAAQQGAPAFWDRSKKQPVFLVEDFLAQLPRIPPSSLSVIYGWHLLDLLPRDSLPKVVDRFSNHLRPGGFLFCLLREPYLGAGSDSVWWLEGLTSLGTGGLGAKPFPYPALSNRDAERLVPGRTVKTFLTRSGLREVLVVR